MAKIVMMDQGTERGRPIQVPVGRKLGALAPCAGCGRPSTARLCRGCAAKETTQ